jgi:hypothetical protein
MANDIDHDEERPLAELVSCFPAGKHGLPTTGKIRRWILRGVRGIKLEGRQVGATWFSSPAACERFCRQLNYGRPEASKPDPRKARKVRRLLIARGFISETEAAMQDLPSAG